MIIIEQIRITSQVQSLESNNESQWKKIMRSVQTAGLNHVILTIADTERSQAFYGDLPGFPVIVIKEDSDNVQLEFWLTQKKQKPNVG